jgi:hypothetical protein
MPKSALRPGREALPGSWAEREDRARPILGVTDADDAASGGHLHALTADVAVTARTPGSTRQVRHHDKHKKHGLLFLALTDETGNLIWISSARHDHLPARLRAARLGALADLGFTGLDPDPEDPVIITGYKSTRTSKTTPAQRHANQALSAARAPVERAFSDLKNWRILTRLRLSPAKATALLRALLVLTRQQTTR